jgi:hypothetical protein
MERILTLISIAVTGVATCTAAFIFGLIVGIGRFELVWYFTSSVFINYAFGLVVVFGFIALLALATDFYYKRLLNWIMRNKSSTIRIMDLIIVGIVLLGACIWISNKQIPTSHILTIAPLFIATLIERWHHHRAMEFLWEFFKIPSERILGAAFNSVVITLWVSVFCGMTLGSWHTLSSTFVCTDFGALNARITFPLERGLLVVNSESAQVIAWPEVKTFGWLRKNSLLVPMPSSQQNLVDRCNWR